MLRPPVPNCKGRLHSAHTGSMLPTTLWGMSPFEVQKVSSEDLRTPVLGQAVNQSSELRSALVFFATAQLFRERSLGRSRSSEKEVRLVFAKEAREGPNAQD